MKEKDNKNKAVIIILTILLIVSILYIGYDKIYSNGDNTTNDVNSSMQGEQNSTLTQNLYAIYSDNIKNQISNNVTDFFEVGTGYMYGEVVYNVLLNKNLELIVRIEEKKFNCDLLGDYKIANNVIGFAIADSGPGGLANVYFIKTDGTVSCANVGDVFATGAKNIEVIDNFLSLKNIVSIVQTSHDDNGLTKEPMFIDIDGNVFKNTAASWD